MPAHPDCANRLFPPPSPLPWAPAPAPRGQPAWKTHVEDRADPHGTRLLVPALRTGPGAPALLAGDKPTDLYYDLSAGALHVCVEVPGGRAWRAASSQSYTKAEVDRLVADASAKAAAAEQAAADASATASEARTAADAASAKAAAAEQAADAASAKADAKQDRLSFTSVPDDKDNKVVTQDYVDGVKADAASAGEAAAASAAAAAGAEASAASAGEAAAASAADAASAGEAAAASAAAAAGAEASAASASEAAGQAQDSAAAAVAGIETAQAAARSAESAAEAAQSAAEATRSAAQSAQSAVSQHVASKVNPHSVTASQVGAYTKGEVDAKLASKQDGLSFTPGTCSAENPVALRDYVDGFVSEESDPVFAAWRSSSLIRMGKSSGDFFGVSSGVFAGLGECSVENCDGLVALGQSPELVNCPGIVSIGGGHCALGAEGSVLLGVEPATFSEYTVAIGRWAGSSPEVASSQAGNDSAVAIGDGVLFHGPSTFSVVADGLDKVYLGAGAGAETLEKKLGDWFTDTLVFAGGSEYAYDGSSNPAVTEKLLDAELATRDSAIDGKQERLYFTNTEATDETYAPDRDNYVITRKMLNTSVSGLAGDIQKLEDLHYQDWCHRHLYYLDPPSVDLSVNEYAKTNDDGIKLNEYPLEYNHAVVVVNDEADSMDVLTVTLPYTFGRPVKSGDAGPVNDTFDCILYVTVAEHEIVRPVFKLTDYFAGKELSSSYKRGFSVSYSEGSPAVLDGGEDGTTYVVRILGRNGDPGKKAPQFYIDIRRYAAEAAEAPEDDLGGSYGTVLALGNELDLSAGCDRRVVRMELDDGASASLRLPDLSYSPEKAFDCAVWIVPRDASGDGSLTLTCADGGVHLADGSEAKVWKDGVTAVAVTGMAQVSAGSAPVYLVSVKHFSKLDAS